MNEPRFTANAVRTLLSQGLVKICFTKKDGSRRELVGTTHDSLTPPANPNAKPKKPNPDMVNLWVPEVEGWRGFNIDQLSDTPVLVEKF